MANPTAPVVLDSEEQLAVLKTWRYLRLAMAGLAIALFAAIVEDFIRGHGSPSGGIAHCVQGSISAYYYTPVHSVFVGSLVAIGVCLYCLQGDTAAEDALLNIAGMCAPVVAFVPTNPPGRCLSTAVSLDRLHVAGTSMFALPFLETAALIVTAVLVKRGAGSAGPITLRPAKAELQGYAVATAIVVFEWILWAVYLSGHNCYTRVVHYSSAAVLFACIFLVVWIRAAARSPEHKFWHWRHPNLDTWIIRLMIASLVAFGILKLAHWTYAVLQIEACLIALFMAYWIDETRRGWHPGFGDPTAVTPKVVAQLSARGPTVGIAAD